jgi:hypothetical protein
VTFKDLQRLVQAEAETGASANISHTLKDKPFWIWLSTEHKQTNRTNKGSCCFNHIIGLPTKDGVEKPIFDYKLMLYRALLEPSYLNSYPSSPTHEPNNTAHTFKLKHLWVKKATGLGVTEFMLRFMAWLCLRISCR